MRSLASHRALTRLLTWLIVQQIRTETTDGLSKRRAARAAPTKARRRRAIRRTARRHDRAVASSAPGEHLVAAQRERSTRAAQGERRSCKVDHGCAEAPTTSRTGRAPTASRARTCAPTAQEHDCGRACIKCVSTRLPCWPIADLRALTARFPARELYDATWRALHSALTVASTAELEALPSPFPLEPPQVFITSWVDYTHKYGTAYSLTDGSAGLYFNDSTTMVLSPDKMCVLRGWACNGLLLTLCS